MAKRIADEETNTDPLEISATFQKSILRFCDIHRVLRPALRLVLRQKEASSSSSREKLKRAVITSLSYYMQAHKSRIPLSGLIDITEATLVNMRDSLLLPREGEDADADAGSKAKYGSVDSNEQNEVELPFKLNEYSEDPGLQIRRVLVAEIARRVSTEQRLLTTDGRRLDKRVGLLFEKRNGEYMLQRLTNLTLQHYLRLRQYCLSGGGSGSSRGLDSYHVDSYGKGSDMLVEDMQTFQEIVPFLARSHSRVLRRGQVLHSPGQLLSMVRLARLTGYRDEYFYKIAARTQQLVVDSRERLQEEQKLQLHRVDERGGDHGLVPKQVTDRHRLAGVGGDLHQKSFQGPKASL
ncbi:unnamed protein product [Amoebophrya sp. A25]|nr:unnamed protein product [Amoebophrya sp. A25]|eukprot:GSA25T00010607001.1